MVKTCETCAQCKHWNIAEAGPRRVAVENRGQEMPPVSPRWSNCLRIEPGFSDKKSVDWSTERAAVWDGSEYFAELETREDFGCVLWQPRDYELKEGGDGEDV